MNNYTVNTMDDLIYVLDEGDVLPGEDNLLGMMTDRSYWHHKSLRKLEEIEKQIANFA